MAKKVKDGVESKVDNIVSLDQSNCRVKVKAFELNNPIVFEFFQKLAKEQYDDTFLRALYIGVLAMQEDRLASFFAKTENELGTHLESLKAIFEMKKEVFFKTAVKGLVAENDIIDFLNNDFFIRLKYDDVASASGTVAGQIPGNKTGDILCRVNQKSTYDIAIEVKLNKTVTLGDIESKEIFTKNVDTAWGQIIESKANRNTRVGIIIFDRALVDKSITAKINNIGYIKGVGFIAIVDSMRGDYSSLEIAYELARELVLANSVYNAENDTLALLVKRLLHDINSMLSIKKQCDNIDKASVAIKETLQQNMLSFEFTKKYLEKFKTDGELNSNDLLSFYNGEEIKTQFSALKLKEL